MRKIIKRC